jgi:exonuclease SbcD
VTTTWHPLIPKKDLILLAEPFDTLIDPNFYGQYERGHKNYFSIKIQSLANATNARATLAKIYGDVVEVQYDLSTLVADKQGIPEIAADADGADDKLIAAFYNYVTGTNLNDNQQRLLDDTLSDLYQQEEG